MGTAWALPVLAALVPLAARSERLRQLMPLAAVSALLLGVLNAGALVWLAPALGACLFLVVREHGLRGAVRPTAAFIGFLVAFALPTIVTAPAFLTSNIVSFDPIANLGAPLDPIQLAGIWPVGDFRADPELGAATKVLILVAVIAAAAAVVWMLRRQVWALPIYVRRRRRQRGGARIWSTPWIEGKAFATAAPAIPFAAVVAAGLLLARGRVVEGAVLGAVVAGAVVWSNVLQYHDVWLGPREQLAELSDIGERFAGDGPALQTEYQPYGVRHFLRKLDAEGASELRVRPVLLRDGRQLDKGAVRESSTSSPTPTSASTGRWCSAARRPRAAPRPTTSSRGAATGTTCGSVPRPSPLPWPSTYRSATVSSRAPSPTARKWSGWRRSPARVGGLPPSFVHLCVSRERGPRHRPRRDRGSHRLGAPAAAATASGSAAPSVTGSRRAWTVACVGRPSPPAQQRRRLHAARRGRARRRHAHGDAALLGPRPPSGLRAARRSASGRSCSRRRRLRTRR